MDADGAADTLRYSTCSGTRNINLYSMCDSYLFEFIKGEKDFCRVNKYASIRTIDDGRLNVEFDTSKINVLMIERTERYIRWHLSNPNYYITYRLTTGGGAERMIPATYTMTEYTFNKDINENLEFNLFDYHFLSPIKQLKAWFNRKIFNRLDGEVTIAPNGDRLLLRRTIDTTLPQQSSFSTLTDNEIAAMAGNLNDIEKAFKQMGFDYVYFCGIPSPVTVYGFGSRKYNGLLPRLQRYPGLHMPCIDMYSLFMNHRSPSLYYRSDTHWDSTGVRMWQALFNGILDTLPDRRRQ